MLEIQHNGTMRLREAPGQLSQLEREREQKKQQRLDRRNNLAEAEAIPNDSVAVIE